MIYSSEQVLNTKWFPKPNDVIGGWCVMDVDETPSTARRAEVADFIDYPIAKHIADLHNAHLEEKKCQVDSPTL